MSNQQQSNKQNKRNSNLTKKNKKSGNLNLTNTNNKITYISSQIYQGYSGDFKKGIEEGSDKLAILLEEQMKEYEKAITFIIEQSILSSSSGTTQYFNNENDFKRHADSLKNNISNKMLKDILDKTLEKVSKSMSEKNKLFFLLI